MDLRFCDLYMFCLMAMMSWTGILTQKASAPSWKPKSRPANHDSIISKTEGNDIKLTCGTNGNPKPSIIWYKDGRLFDDKKRPRTKLHRYSLIMRDVTVKDKGDYQCIVTNIHGSLNFTFIVEVIKLSWPLELEEPQNVTVNEGEDAVFTCRPLNDPSATVKWVKRKNQTGLQTSIGKTSNFLETGTKEMLVVRNVTMQDAGQYHCLVGNYFGIRQVNAWLNVIPRPTTTTTTTTTTTPTTTTTTPTTTTTTPTTTTTTPTTTTTTPTTTTTTTTAPTTTTTFWPEPTPFDWNDEFDEGKKKKKDKKKKKKNKNKKKKNKKKNKKNKKDRNKNRDHSKIEPDYGEIDEGFGTINTNPPDEHDWFRRNERIRPDEQTVVDNNGLFPYSEGTDINTFDNNESDSIDNSDIEFNNGMPGEKTQQQETSEKDIDVWTIYIIVGSVAGGVLLIGVVAIIVALCCNRYEDEGYKHTNV